MIGTRRILAAAVVAAGLLAVSGARGGIDTITHGSGSSLATVNMAFVDIGNAGNTGDTPHGGYGSVGYAYRMGTYEVSAAQWAAVLAVAPSVGNTGYTAAGWTTSSPTAGTSWYEAAKFCNWLTTGNVTTGVYTLNGNSVTSITDHQTAAATLGVATAYFIPTEDEWYKAAYYDPTANTGAGGYWDYPTGSDTAPTATAGSAIPGQAVYNGQAAPANVNNSGGLSPFLTMGQGGNVWEWNETVINTSFRGLRGGSFGYSDYTLRADSRLNHDPAYENYIIGVRVASFGIVPEPGSLGLLLLGLAGMTMRRRRSGR